MGVMMNLGLRCSHGGAIESYMYGDMRMNQN